MKRLQVLALATIVLSAGNSGFAQSAKQDKTLAELPAAPVPVYTEPLFIRPTLHNYSKGRLSILNPLAIYEQQVADKARRPASSCIRLHLSVFPLRREHYAREVNVVKGYFVVVFPALAGHGLGRSQVQWVH